MRFMNQLLGNLKHEKCILLLRIILRGGGGGGVDLADMQVISKYNKRIRYLLYAIDLFSKYACVVPFKDKKGVSIVNAFQKILSNSKKKQNK